MKQISKTDYERLQAYPDKLREFHDEIDTIISDAQDKINDVLQRLNETLGEAQAVVDDFRSEAETYYDERSDAWREGDAGQEYETWVRELESACDELNDQHCELDVSDTLDGIECAWEAIENIRQSSQG